MNSYENLEALFKTDMQSTLNNQEFLQQLTRKLENEVIQINRNMGFLPTSKEIEALPDLKFLADLTKCFTEETNYFDHNLKNVPEQREEIIRALFGQVTRAVLKTKIYNDKTIVQTADRLFQNLIIWSTRQIANQSPSQLQLLSTIIDINVDYYKSNGREDKQLFPFGFNEQNHYSDDHKKWVDDLKPGDKVDALKQHLSRKFWSPAVVKCNDWSLTKLRFVQESTDSYVYKKYLEIQPADSKLKEYQWRLQLKEGDLVDYYSYRTSWVLAKIVKVTHIEADEDDDAKVKINLEIFDDKEVDSNDYYSTSIFAGNIAPPQKFSIQSDQSFDADDELYLKNQTKKRYAIMRQTNSPTSSIYFVKYINIFGEQGGFDYIIDVFSDKFEVQDYTLQSLMGIVRSSIESFVRPFIKQHGEVLLKNLQNFLTQNSKENLRKIDKNNLKTVLDTVNALVNRIYNKNEAQKICQQNEIDLALICLKSEFLEKQLFGSKILSNLERKVRNFDTQMDQKELAEILKKEEIFQVIIKGHPSLIQKGDSVIKTLFSLNEVSEQQLQDLWNQILKTDMESRNALLSLLKQTLNNFTLEQLLFFLDKMIESAHNITDQELFDVLFQLKKTGWHRFNNYDIVEKVNEVLWEIIQSKQEMKKDYMKEVIKNFVSFIKEHQNYQYIDKIIDNICRNENPIRNVKLLKKLFMVDALQKTIVEKSKKKQLIKSIIDCVESIVLSKRRNSEELINEDSFSKLQKQLIEKQLSFISKIYKSQSQSIRFSEIEKIWKLFKENNLEYNYIYQWLLGFFVREPEEGFANKYKNFFDQNVSCLKENNKNNMVSFFWILMIKMNINNKNLINHKVNLETNSLSNSYKKSKNFILLNKEISGFIGIDKLWEIYNTTQNEQLEQKLCEHFCKLYTEPMPEIPYNEQIYLTEKQSLVEQCKQEINDQDPLKVRKACKLLKYLILNEEVYGLGDLKSWNYFKEDSKFGLSFEKENSYYYREKSTILIKKNKTLAQLKKKISNEASMSFRSIIIEQEDVPSSTYSHLYNSLTLKELIDTDKRHFILKELELPEKEMAPLLTPDKDNFTTKALAVFSEIFSDYSTDGKMSKLQLAQFTMKATDGTYCSEDDDRIRQVFQKYSDEDPNYLLENGFVKFFLDSATHSDDKLSTVRYNISSLGYDKTLTLKKLRNQNSFKSKNQQSIRYKLAKDKEFFNALFTKMDNKQKNGVTNLLYFLTPNIDVIQQLLNDPIKKLKEEVSSKQWNYLCVILYQLMYKQKRMNKLLQNFDLEFNESQSKLLFNKLYDYKFLEITMRKLQSFDQNNNSYLKLIYYPLKCLEGLFQIGIDFFRKDYIEDTMNFIAYSMKLKKLKMKEKNKEKKNADNQTETKSLQEYGPKQKDEKNDKEKNKGNKEVNNLEELKKKLQSSSDNIQDFLHQISYQKFNPFLIQILQLILDGEVQYNFGNKKNLTKTLMILLLSSLTVQPKNLKNLLNKDKGELKGLLFKGLTSQKSINRLFFKNFYVYLTSNLKDFEHKRAFLRVIMSSIKETQENDEMHVLIELASNILNEISEIKEKKEQTELHEEFDFSKIFIEFSEKLYNYVSKETEFDSQEDNTLVAIMTFMEKIISADDLVLQEMDETKQKNLLTFLFQNCLFNVKNNQIHFEDIMCKSNKSRQKAHELMTLIAQSNIKLSLLLLVTGFQPLAKLLPEISSQKQFSSSSNRNKQHGYTGLRNPGCICYMNAMLQQFYCIPTFRYGILMADDYKKEELFQTQDMLTIDDNVFHQLQKMFAYLDYSQRQDFFPQEFCASYKDSSKQRVNVLVQQDAYEFLNMIFDKMETSLKPTPFQGIIDSVFMGRNCCVFTCQGCGFKRERLEINYNLSLEVKNIENLEESFDKFIQKEVISDFMCDSCKQKKDVTKQTFLKELPNVMVIHLQKIIFDLETLMNIKISSRYEFPQTLNLQKFVYQEEEQEGKDEDEVKEKLPDDPEDYEYKLVGVVIHRGNAHFGHYISLINTNRKDPNRPNNTKDEWLEFDDSKISVFNMKNFEEECFGTKIENEYHQGMYNIEGNVSQSAYILVYDKLKKSKVKFSFKESNRNEVDKVKDNLIVKDNFKFENDQLETDFYNIGKFLPEKYKKQIEQDNINKLLENQLFSSNFTNTFASMLYENELPIISVDMEVPDNLSDYQKTFAKMIIKIVPDYFVKVYCVAYQNYKIKKIVQTLESALMIRPECIVEFFQNFFFPNQMFLRYQFMQSMDSGIQYSINHIITVSLTILIRQYNLQMQYQTFENPQNDKEHAASILTFMIENFYLGQVKEFEQQKVSRKTSYFFQSLKNICILNPTIIEYLLQGNHLSFLRDLYLKQDPGNCRNSEHALTHILHIIYLILQNVYNRMNENGITNRDQLIDYFNYFAKPQLLFKIMKEDYRFNKYYSLNMLTELVCRDNLDNSFMVIKKSLKQLTMVGDTESIPYLEALTTLLQLEDQYQEIRIKAILGIPTLNEQKTKEKNQRIYIYGLSKESSLKRTVYKYLSSFCNEQGLVQGVFSHKENNEVICLLYIHYILISAIQNQKVMSYLIKLPPYNYVSSNLFDWVANYIAYNLKNMQKSYNAPKADLMYNYFQNLEEIVRDFEKRFQKQIQEDFDYTEEESQKFKYFVTTEMEELDSVKENYIIGKTVSQNLVQKKVLCNNGDDEFSLSVFLIKVSLMKNRTNGFENMEISKDVMSYESYIQKSQLKGTLKKFIGDQSHQYYNLEDEEESREELKPIGADSEDEQQNEEENSEKNENENEEVIQEEPTEEETNYTNKRYILRLSYTNNCKENYALQIKVDNRGNETFNKNEFIVLAKAGKKDNLITNITLNDIDGKFYGLQIKARFLENEERTLQSISDLVQTSYEDIYKLEYSDQ